LLSDDQRQLRLIVLQLVTPQHATRSEGFPKGSKYD
jgi:hypothetical protein